jgi:hypothetical protein
MSEPYDIYLFEDCNDASNLFRFENIPGTLTEGYVYNISGGSGFTGYAKVIAYSEEGTIYSTDGVVFVGGATQCPTPTPTQTPEASPTPTPSVTPTEEIFEMPMLFSTPPSGCATTDFCFRTSLPSLSGYSGNYTVGADYNGVPTYSGDGTITGVIYYYSGDTSYWCLSNTLGGTCYLRGASPCTSDCPDIAVNDFFSGICPTPTPTPINCGIFNFNAYFDCDWEPIPTPTPSVACDDVNFTFDIVGVTPTPTPTSDSCNLVAVSFSMSGYTPATTPTVTLTPSVTLTRTVNIREQVTFEMLDETFSCVSVKVLTDCQSGQEYYVTDNLSFSGIPAVIGMTLLVDLNGGFQCVTYTRDDTNFSSNSSVGEIVQLYSSCEYCSIIPTPTPTVTTTPTITPSSSQTPTPSITASPSVTPSQTATIGSTPPVTPTPTQTPTRTQTPTPSITPSPSATPNYVYVYQSCSPIFPNVLNTQVIQTQVVSFANQPGAIFKDFVGNCWTYIGRFDSTYIAPPSVITVTFEGNYFDGVLSLTYPDCTTCQTPIIVDGNYNYFNGVRCDNGASIVVKSLNLQSEPSESFNINLNIFNLGDFGIPQVDLNFDLNVKIGDIVTVSDPTGDFCCTITNTTTAQNTNYDVAKPINVIPNCSSCPTYKTYLANACDGTEQNVTILALNNSVTLPIGTIIKTNVNVNCYTIIEYSGVIADVWVNPQFTRFVDQTFTDCPTCLNSIPPTYYFVDGGGSGGGGEEQFLSGDNTVLQEVQF